MHLNDSVVYISRHIQFCALGRYVKPADGENDMKVEDVILFEKIMWGEMDTNMCPRCVPCVPTRFFTMRDRAGASGRWDVFFLKLNLRIYIYKLHQLYIYRI
jgi:hypothetical protein